MHLLKFLFLPLSLSAGGLDSGIDWKGLTRQSANFLLLEHSFRLATEAGTREGMGGPFFPGYSDAIRSLHGWADGDPFYVNYIGHPMMGSVAASIFVQNDRRYRDAVFGKDKHYWKSRLRATAFSALYSAQFEIGPFSEASIGKVQRVWPQHGFVDLAVTPTIGFAWTIAEDSIDKFVITRIEQWTTNNWVRLFVRSGLNPSRSTANVLAGRVPWYRDNRGRIFSPQSYVTRPLRVDADPPVNPPPGVAPFEFNLTFTPQRYSGTGVSCLGGSANAAFRIAESWQLVTEVGGCKLTGLPPNLTGDSFSYLAGPRFKFNPQGRLSPHVQVLLGGRRITNELFYPEKFAPIANDPRRIETPSAYRNRYTSRDLDNGFTIAAGAGLDLNFNSALGLRLASIEYRHSLLRPINGVSYDRGLQFSTGLVLHMGTW